VRDSGKAAVSGQRSEKGRRQKGRTGAQALQRIRLDVAKRMTQAVDVYFSQLADRVVERAGKNAEGGMQKADLPSAGSLLNGEDRKKLEAIVKRFYVEVLQLSWETWNYTLGIEKAFDLEDPLVGQLLKLAATNVKDIHDTTMQEIRDALQYGNANGWSIDQLVRGDENQPGIRSIVDEVYKGRARTIARTELGVSYRSAVMDESQRASESLGLVTKLLWVSALMATTRRSHADLHGRLLTRTEVTEFYSKNGNAINCRCSQVPTVVDENGNAFAKKIFEKMAKQEERWMQSQGIKKAA